MFIIGQLNLPNITKLREPNNIKIKPRDANIQYIYEYQKIDKDR